MKKILLFLLSLLPLYFSCAQNPAYQEKYVIGSVPAMTINSMAIDIENNLYLTDMSRVVKVKDGKILLDFKVNKADYNTWSANSEGVILDIEVDRSQFIYLLNHKKNRIEKHDQQGNLIKVFPPIPDTLAMNQFLYTSLHMDRNGHLNILDKYKRRILVYNAEGTLLETITLADPVPSLQSAQITIAFDNQNNIYVAEIKAFSWDPRAYITLLNREGKIIQRFSDAVMKESGFNRSYFLAIDVDKNGDVYVYNNSTVYTNTIYWPIVVFSADGSIKKSLPVNAERGSLILFDNQNNMYHKLASSNGDYLLKYDQEHKLVERMGYLRRPYEVAFDVSDNLYILDHLKGKLVKYNAEGTEDKAFKLNVNYLFNPLTFTIDDKGFIYILEYGGGSSNPTSSIKKFDLNGNLVATVAYIQGSYEGYYPQFASAGLAVDKEGNIYVTTYNNGDTHSLIKFNAQGAAIAKFGPKGKNPGQLSNPFDVTVDAAGQVYVLDMNGRRIQKFSSSGKFMQQYGSFNANEESIPLRNSIAADAFGNVLVATQVGNNAGGLGPDVKYYDLTGNLSFSLPISSASVAMNRRGSLIAMADPKYDVVTVYAATSSREYNLIAGNIYHDANANCVFEANETGLADMLVKAEPGPYYGATDASGNYRLLVGKGSFQVSPLSENNSGKMITITCASGKAADTLHFENFGNYSSGHDFGAQVTISPYLNVSVSSTRRRRCFRNTTTVSYGNTGFATARGAKVTLQLPEYVAFISASIPHTKDAKGNFIFAVGDLQPSQRGTITLLDSVSCADPSIRGLTVCTKAWITPANTYPTPANWNRADISVTGKTLEDNQARFVIRNNGPGDMTDSLFFRIYQDAQLMLNSKYKLAATDSLVLRFAPTGRALRLEVDQPEGHPLKATAGVNVEVRQRNTLSLPSIPMMAFPPDDPEPEIASNCLPILDSFDPNDKQVVPAGLTSERYTPTNTPLRYTIRFQNTGNDVAYRVVVVDTLSADLDLSTLQVGAASHPFTYNISGKGRAVLSFTFNNILLPDSTHDPVGSNGFVQFSIRPTTELPEKTKVENFADIFFDYNEPVRTNTTLNSIFDMPMVNSDQQLILRDVIATPALASFWPGQSRAGSVVTLTGSNFSPAAAANKVFFNNTPAPVLQASATSLKVVVPDHAFSGKIKVITADGAAQSSSDYVIYQPPTITALSATEGVPGAVITITGTHFSPVLNQDTVSFNSVAAKVLEATETTIKAEVPAGATLGRIRLKTLGGQAESTPSFRVWYPPVISSFSPAKGKAGTPITLTGSNFAEAAARNGLQFEGKTAEVLQATETSLVVKVPAAAPSGKLRLQTPGGHTSSGSGFTFIPAPVITAFTPASANAGATITITGENFQADNQADTVYFNEKPAKVLQVTPTALQVQAPKGVTSGTIVVAGAGGRAQASGFQVPELAPAEAISIYPNPTKGGITVNWFKADFTLEQMQVYNAIGKLVAEQGLTGAANDEQQLLLSQFGPGVYTFRFQTSAGTIVKRVVAL